MMGKMTLEGRDRFLSPSDLLALLESDLVAATKAYLARKCEFIELGIAADVLIAHRDKPQFRRGVDVSDELANARDAYRAAWWVKYNIERRLRAIAKKPRRDALEAFDRLLSDAQSIGASSCISWTGLKTPLGYGLSYINGRHQLAHRISYAMKIGVPIAAIRGVVVRHRCDNPTCINPAHLEPGTQADNVRDMHERGRNGHGGAAGSRNASAKLRESDIPLIRERLARGEKGAAIARDYAISDTAISRIKRGRNWTHTAHPA